MAEEVPIKKGKGRGRKQKQESKTTQDSEPTLPTQVDKKKGNKEKEKDKEKEKEKEREKSKNQKKPATPPKKAVPKDKKVKQPLIKEDAESLLEYLKQQNRPFTINYLKDTLFLKLAALQKNMEALVQKGDIVAKDVGSTKVYLINQNLMPTVSQAELGQLATELEGRTEEFKLISSANSKLQEQVKSLLRIPTVEELRDQKMALVEQISTLRNKLLQYEDANFKRASAEEVTAIEAEHEQMLNLCRKRKKIYNEAIGAILAESDMTAQQFEAMIGVFRD